jgi:hypothetical protein
VKLLVQIENGKDVTERFVMEGGETSAVAAIAVARAIAGRMDTFFARAVNVAKTAHVCASFVVSVHHLDSSCDHEHGG